VQWAEGVVNNEGLGRKTSKGLFSLYFLLFLFLYCSAPILPFWGFMLEFMLGFPLKFREKPFLFRFLKEGMQADEGNLVCCIYHAPKGIDESSDESSSGSSSDDSDSADDGAARPAGGRRAAAHGHGHGHDHGKGKGRARSPNAYEKMPKAKGGGSGLKENKP